MIDLHAWATPNAHKVSIMLEEIGTEYRVIPVNIGAGDQFAPDFLKISPNNRMPAIVDHDAPGGPLAIFESGAILLYLAEKSGRFCPMEPHARYDVIQWMMWQMGELGPMLGQASHFRHFATEEIPYAQERYNAEAKRLLGVLERRLADRDFIAGDYSIADMACYSWTTILPWLGIAHENTAIGAWQERVAARPAVARGMELLAEKRMTVPKLDEEARRNLLNRR